MRIDPTFKVVHEQRIEANSSIFTPEFVSHEFRENTSLRAFRMVPDLSNVVPEFAEIVGVQMVFLEEAIKFVLGDVPAVARVILPYSLNSKIAVCYAC